MKVTRWLTTILVALAVASCGGTAVTVQTDAPDPEITDDGVAGDADMAGPDVPGETVEDALFDTDAGPECQIQADCADNLACVDNVCVPCKFTAQCDEGACIGGACLQCKDSLDCGGWLCEDGDCIPCTDPAATMNCQDEYGSDQKPYYCDESGFCLPDVCDSGWDCHLSHMVCKDGVCQPCGDTAECMDETMGQYDAGTQCLESDNLCWSEGNTLCAVHEDCPEDLPICGDNHLCRECNANAECDGVVPEDDISDGLQALCTPTGQCAAGNCGDIDEVLSCLDVNQGLCAGNICVPCVADEPCWAEYDNGDLLCIDGECVVADCHDITDMAKCLPAGMVCDVEYMCAVCTLQDEPDAICLQGYAEADEPWRCCDDKCVQGDCCVHPDCFEDQLICDNYTCASCAQGGDPSTEDWDCKGAYNDNPLMICTGGLCVEGCAPDAVCTDIQEGEGACVQGQICGTDNRWQPCVVGSGDCASAMMSLNWICEPMDPDAPETGGLCLAGCPEAPCPAGMLCDGTHHCIACTDVPGDLEDQDAACEFEFFETQYLCDPVDGQCKLGCDASSPCADQALDDGDCLLGQVCGLDNRWRDCDSDSSECEVLYGENWICDPGTEPETLDIFLCWEGCTPTEAVELDDGTFGYCDDTHHPAACVAAGEEQDDQDLACDQAYGDNWICDLEDPDDPESLTACLEGCAEDDLCIISGDPEEDPFCLAGQVCGDDNRWRDCLDDDDCVVSSSADDKICEVFDTDGDGSAWLCTDGCPSEPCALGMVCASDHRCGSCADAGDSLVEQDLACKGEYGEEWICVEGGCLDGCTPATLCGVDNPSCVEGQFCGDDNRWRDCQSNLECQAAGTGDLLCLDGLCQEGECIDPVDCHLKYGIDGYLCDESHACVNCELNADGDTACRYDYNDPTYICAYNASPGIEMNLCDEGCETGECPQGQICQADHHCGGCVIDEGQPNPYSIGDQQCAYEFGGEFVCNPAEPPDYALNYCAQGCADGDCADGAVCKTNGHCGACQTDVECVDNYGAQHICLEGICAEGDCHIDADCATPEWSQWCLDNFCTPCTMHGVNQIEGIDECPVGERCCLDGNVCDDGKCYQGNCCEGLTCLPGDLDCTGGGICTDHSCECATDGDCWAIYPDCVQKLTNVCQNNHCLKVHELIALHGEAAVKHSSTQKLCLLKKIDYPDTEDDFYECYNEGDSYSDPTHPDEDCLICWTTGSAGKLTEPTPGDFNGTLNPNWCYIDDPDDGDVGAKRCHPAALAAESDEIPFWQCKQCIPDSSDRDTLFNWSVPTTEPSDPGLLGQRALCDDPYNFGTWDNPIADGEWIGDQATEGNKELGQYLKADYKYSGSSKGFCWQKKCRGMAWQPWLPVGMAGAGGVWTTADTGADFALVGSFGGGFGAGVPTLVNEVGNPGCDCVDSDDCGGSLACVDCRCVCDADSDCGAGYCLYGTCVDGCGDDADCGPDAPFCVNGQCFECDGPEVCAEGESCEVGVCQ